MTVAATVVERFIKEKIDPKLFAQEYRKIIQNEFSFLKVKDDKCAICGHDLYYNSEIKYCDYCNNIYDKNVKLAMDLTVDDFMKINSDPMFWLERFLSYRKCLRHQYSKHSKTIDLICRYIDRQEFMSFEDRLIALVKPDVAREIIGDVLTFTDVEEAAIKCIKSFASQ